MSGHDSSTLHLPSVRVDPPKALDGGKDVFLFFREAALSLLLVQPCDGFTAMAAWKQQEGDGEW